MANNVTDLVDCDESNDQSSSGQKSKPQQLQHRRDPTRKRQRTQSRRGCSANAATGVFRTPTNKGDSGVELLADDVIVIDGVGDGHGNDVYSSPYASLAAAPQNSNRKRKQHTNNSVDTCVALSPEVVIIEDGDLKPRAKTTPPLTEEVALTPQQRILEVFPDIALDHCETLLEQAGIPRQNQNRVAASIYEAMIQSVLLQLAEAPTYPKAKDTSTAARRHNHGALVNRQQGTSQTDYMSPSSFTPTPQYIDQAITILMADFPFLSKLCIKRHLSDSCQQHYAVFHDNLCNAIMDKTTSTAANSDDTDEKQYNALLNALTGSALTFRQTVRVKKLEGITGVLKRPRKPTKAAMPITDPILKDEVAYVKHKRHTYMEEMSAKLQRARARKESERAGSTMECQCCFADVAMEEMISCRTEGHLFCVDCIRRFAEEQVFGQGNLGIDKSTNSPALELMCMCGEGCTSGFEPQLLRKALPEKVLTKYEELCFQAAVDKAGIEDMCTCPKCGYQAVLPSTQMIFACPVQDCQHESCRKCGENPHIPLRCEEVEKQNETKGRLKVEEAISAAKIRTCPKPGCGKKFVKSDGCNKITCSCRTLVCYICRSTIPPSVGYAHFCQTPMCNHQNCKKCRLYSNAEEDDALAMREAGIKAAEEVREQSLMTDAEPTGHTKTNRRVDMNGIQINVDSILGNPTNANTGR